MQSGFLHMIFLRFSITIPIARCNKNNVAKLTVRNPFTDIFSAYLRILAKNASHRAARKKYRSRPVFSAYYRFFPEMFCRACNACPRAAKAEAVRIVSVNTALSRAEIALAVSHIISLNISVTDIR